MIPFIPRVLPHIPPRIRVVRICTFGEFMTPFVAVVVNVTMTSTVGRPWSSGRTDNFFSTFECAKRPQPAILIPHRPTDRPTDRAVPAINGTFGKELQEKMAPLLSSSSEYFLSQGGGQLYFSRRIEQNLLGRV